MGLATEDSGFSFPKNLSVWWSEETEYVLQRIERWAAYARGYNRLRSVRLSPGRMTMQEDPDNRWSVNRATDKHVVESNTWSPKYHQQRRQQHQPPAERARLRCCALGNLDYKSNGKLDSNCLEAYSLDHSIYFKTIGEIRNELRPENKDKSAGKNEDENSNSGNAGRSRTTTTTTATSAVVSATPATTPLDCGDFLSSDFDELDDEGLEELDNVDYELRDQLGQLEASCNYDEDPSRLDNCNDVIQVCRSAMNEDEINNNFRMTGFPRKFNRPAAAAQ